MKTKNAALINNGVVENVIVIEPVGIPEFQKAIECDYLIPVSDIVQIGDTYDAEKSIFLCNGVRIYPEKTDSERITELSELVNTILGVTNNE